MNCGGLSTYLMNLVAVSFSFSFSNPVSSVKKNVCQIFGAEICHCSMCMLAIGSTHTPPDLEGSTGGEREGVFLRFMFRPFAMARSHPRDMASHQPFRTSLDLYER